MGPWDPSVGHSIRVQGRSREPRNFSRGDSGPMKGLAMDPLGGRMLPVLPMGLGSDTVERGRPGSVSRCIIP